MNITQTPIWQALQQHQQQTADVHMRTQFEQNPQRFAEMHETLYGLLLDYSKNRIDAAALDLL
ncbi:glucose-6-phosphate isomerase, partial [Guyparkeria sp. 1SP6A2]|nr:glucose-6-phosphate isomerase [Guyparkeria sp. 1SP6A2]